MNDNYLGDRSPDIVADMAGDRRMKSEALHNAITGLDSFDSSLMAKEEGYLEAYENAVITAIAPILDRYVGDMNAFREAVEIFVEEWGKKMREQRELGSYGLSADHFLTEMHRRTRLEAHGIQTTHENLH